MIVIGTDEAGYGPNLGPFIVTATVWRLPEQHDRGLNVCMNALDAAGMRIADSKKIFHGGGSLEQLETSVLSVFAHLGINANKDSVLFDHFHALPSAMNDDVAENDLPVAGTQSQIARNAAIFARILEDHAVVLCSAHSRALHAEEFNRQLDRYETINRSGAKAAVLSHTTLELIKEALHSCTILREDPNETILVQCDKHGGRNRYLDCLVQYFPSIFVQVLEENATQSRYRLSYRGHPLEFCFKAKGESEMPIALSSMISKYLRELSMLRFNRFWQNHVPHLKATAGYPVDAKRFRADIAAAQQNLHIPDDAIWRRK